MMAPENNQSDNNNQVAQKAPSDFSINHILNHAGKGLKRSNSCEDFKKFLFNSEVAPNVAPNQLPWLQCTRYCPPKIPRNQKKDGPQKRQLGRHPRIPFTSHQSAVLEEKFKQSPYLSSEEVLNLSTRLDLPGVRVKIWFQNRRARERRERNIPEDSSESSPKSPTSPGLSVSASMPNLAALDTSLSKSVIPNDLYYNFENSFASMITFTAPTYEERAQQLSYLHPQQF